MNDIANDNSDAVLIDARLFLIDWPRSYECRAAFLNQHRALVATNLARDLPDEFSLAVAPDFKLRRCAITWRGKRLVKVLLLPEHRVSEPTSIDATRCL